VHDLQGRSAADLAVDAVVLDRDGALDHADVLALVLLHRLVEGVLDLVPGSGEQGFVVVEGDQVEDQIADGWVRGAQ